MFSKIQAPDMIDIMYLNVQMYNTIINVKLIKVKMFKVKRSASFTGVQMKNITTCRKVNQKKKDFTEIGASKK